MILGADVSGVVEKVGPGVTEFAPGDEVYYTPEIFGPGSNGAYAEYHVGAADIVAEKPASLSHEEAAAVPLAGGSAYEGIVRRLAVQVGETVLIHSGGGGVGSFAVQIARASGARVLASAGTHNQDTLEELGVDVAIDYTSEDVFEVALDGHWRRRGRRSFRHGWGRPCSQELASDPHVRPAREHRFSAGGSHAGLPAQPDHLWPPLDARA